MWSIAVAISMPGAAHAAGAAQQPVVRNPANRVVTVSPVVIRRAVKPGRTYELPVSVANQTGRRVSMQAALNGMRAGAATGPDVIVRTARRDDELIGWSTLSRSSFTMDPGDEATVDLTVRVPDDAASGGRYAAVSFVTAPPGGGDVAISVRADVLVLLAVAGSNRLEPRVTVNVRPEHRFGWGGRSAWVATVRNRGNVHAQMNGSVRLARHPGSDATISLRPSILLPGATRRQRIALGGSAVPALVNGSVRWTFGVPTSTGRAPRVTRSGSASAGWMLVLPIPILALLAVVATAVVARSRRRQYDD